MCRTSHFLQFHTLLLCGLFLAAWGCAPDMADQPHLEPLEGTSFFLDGQSARPLVPGTVARGHLRTDLAFFEGVVSGQPVRAIPTQTVAEHLGISTADENVELQILRRGQERYNIFCTPCHDRVGSGQGMVVLRGYPAAPSYHIERLRNAPDGHFFDVITNGFGRMPSYADQILPADRWAIVAYVRALQLSQHANVSELPTSDRQVLQFGEGEP